MRRTNALLTALGIIVMGSTVAMPMPSSTVDYPIATAGENKKKNVKGAVRVNAGYNTDFSGNQRQYRKKMRANPCRFRSKKHRAKN